MACLALSGAGFAQVSDVTLGYCDGQLPDKGDISYGEKNAYVSGAVYIPGGMIGTYAGNSLTGIRAGLASKLNIDELTVWIRTDLDGEDLVQATVSKAQGQDIVKGWNDIMFDTPYEITDALSQGCYLGYTFHQKGAAFGVAVIDTPSPNGYFVKFGETGEWEDRCAEGTMCIEGLVCGDRLPKLNLTLVDVDVPDILIVDRGNVEVSGTVRNVATHTVTGYDVSLVRDGQKIDTRHFDTALPLYGSEDFSCVLAHGLTAVGEGTGELTILVDNINGGDDEDMSDNAVVRNYAIVQHDFVRRILVEEFTTERCPNCPRVGGYIHDSLQKEKYADNVVVVCHHSGFYTDWLTASFDGEYLELFNGDTYAPAVGVDRKPQFDGGIITCPSSQSDMERAWDKCLDSPAFVSLDIKAKVDAETPNKVHVTVSGARAMEDFCENPVITVMVVEDNIKPRSQAGAGEDYMHYHVNRAVNSVWGDPLTFDGDEYVYECELPLADIWVRGNLQIVAFVSNHNAADVNDREVKNTAALGWADVQGGDSGIAESLIDAEGSEGVYYDLSGRRVNGDLPAGVYVRRAGALTEKIVIR